MFTLDFSSEKTRKDKPHVRYVSGKNRWKQKYLMYVYLTMPSELKTNEIYLLKVDQQFLAHDSHELC